MSDQTLLVVHAGFTLAMVGVMWTVQLVAYPQFRSVRHADFARYAADHANRIVRLLAVFAPAEVLAALFVFLVRPDGVSVMAALGAGALLVAGWVSTGLYFAPLHGRLQTGGFTPDLVDRLITTNWFRTGLWSVRGVLALAFL